MRIICIVSSTRMLVKRDSTPTEVMIPVGQGWANFSAQEQHWVLKIDRQAGLQAQDKIRPTLPCIIALPVSACNPLLKMVKKTNSPFNQNSAVGHPFL